MNRVNLALEQMDQIAVFIIGAWLAVGVIVTAKTHEPEQGGWFWAIPLWPLVLLSKVLP